MDKELVELRDRVARLEQRADHVLQLADRIDSDVNSARDLNDGFVIRSLLHLGGDVLREKMLRWLDQLAEKERDWIEDESKASVDLQRLLYWRGVLQKREPWPDFPPDGWMSPQAE